MMYYLNAFLLLTTLTKLSEAQGFWSWIRGVETETVPTYSTSMVFGPNVEAGCVTQSNGYYDSIQKLFYMNGMYCLGRKYDFWVYNVSSRQYAFVIGDHQTNNNPVWGTIKVSAATTTPNGIVNGGSFVDPVTGLFYQVAGATGSNGDLQNAIFTFNFNTKIWTWIRGTKSSAIAKNTGALNTPSTTACPGPRTGFAYWYDRKTRMFWTFGGYGQGDQTTGTFLQDLWVYNVATDQYTYLGGSGSNTNGVYGPAFASGTWPGSRTAARYVAYSSAENRTYLYGGVGYPDASFGANTVYLADMWVFDMNTKKWAFLGGSKGPNDAGSYVDMGMFSPNASAPGRYAHTMSYDNTNKIVYIFGGANLNGLLNDLWGFNITSSQFAWFTGASTANDPGDNGGVGTQGQENFYYSPGARSYSNILTDSDLGFFQIIGGSGIDYYNLVAQISDVWQFRFDPLGVIAPPKPTTSITSTTKVADITSKAIITTAANVSVSSFINQPEVTSTKKRGPAVIIEQQQQGQSLSGGAVIGIAVAVLIVVLIIVGVIFYVRSKNEKGILIPEGPNPAMTQEMINNYSSYLSATAMAQQQMMGGAPATGMTAMGGAPIPGQTAMVGPNGVPLAMPMPIMPFPGFGFPMMQVPAIPEHLRCDKTAFNLGSEKRQIETIKFVEIEPVNPMMKAYGEKLLGKYFADDLANLPEKNRTFFYQEVQMLWTLRQERSVAKLLAFCGEPGLILTIQYPLGHLDEFVRSAAQPYTKKVAFGFIADMIRTLNAVHFSGHALRAFSPSGFYVEKEQPQMQQMTGREYIAIFSNFASSLPINEGIVQQAFGNIDIYEDNVYYVAPEIFEAKKQNKAPENAAVILKASDLYGFGVMVSFLLSRLSKPQFQ